MPMDRPGEEARKAVASVLGQETSIPFELIVVSAADPGLGDDPRLRLVLLDERNPATRRNAAAAVAAGDILAFIDDDAFAAPSWIDAGVSWLDAHPEVVAVGGPDPAPSDSTVPELISDTLLATRWIGSGIVAHESRPGVFRVRKPWDLALVNLFVRAPAFRELRGFDESIGYIGEDTDLLRRIASLGVVQYHDGIVVHHRRRAFPSAYIRQRWRYRLKTGQRIVRGGSEYRTPAVGALLGGGVSFLAVLLVAPPLAAALLIIYAVASAALAIPSTRLPVLLWPLIPVAFLVHHSTYFLGIVSGMILGLARGRDDEMP
ncbi:MAG: glycosyltransferase family 2 protein [Thermoanaerobaculia bacterium]